MEKTTSPSSVLALALAGVCCHGYRENFTLVVFALKRAMTHLSFNDNRFYVITRRYNATLSNALGKQTRSGEEHLRALMWSKYGLLHNMHSVLYYE